MTLRMRETLKQGAGRAARLAPQAQYARGIFVLSHMRAATTALSNVLCSHPSISGYGETHVRHDREDAPGRVLVNLALRRAFHPRAPYVIDKILHTALDADVPRAFFDARAVFVLRSPGAAIPSIVTLARQSGMADLTTPQGAATYYASRVAHLARLWDRFPPERRFGLTAERLLASPEDAIDRLGAWLALQPRLENRYIPHAATSKGGGGDPTRAATHRRIERSQPAPQILPPPEALPDRLAHRCAEAHAALLARFGP